VALRNIQQTEIAKRYGIVLFNLAHEKKEIETTLKEVQQLHDCFTPILPEWNHAINPTVPLANQQKIVEKISEALQLGKLMAQFLRIVCRNHRLSSLVFILEEFIVKYKENAGIVEGTLETATELPKKEVEKLQERLSQHMGKKIILHQNIKENLLGGVVLRLGSHMIDASLKTRLVHLRQVMEG
jgi:F-type H+-transporting ATPase subunit delta